MKQTVIHIQSGQYRMRAVLLTPKVKPHQAPAILWIHGGGYMFGWAGMVRYSSVWEFASLHGAVVLSPGYRLTSQARYPAAMEDCYAALTYLWDHADEWGVDRDRILVAGESAGGGLAVAVCLRARDEGTIRIAMQMPLYPMLDCEDTPSSKDNHGKVWNTWWNHLGWRRYLGDLYGQKDVPCYASPAKADDYRGLPPCYTYVCEGEPFYCETLAYADNLRQAGVAAKVDVFPGDVHAFDIFRPWRAEVKAAKAERLRAMERILIEGQTDFE